MIPLSDLKKNHSAYIVDFEAKDDFKLYFIERGFFKGLKILLVDKLFNTYLIVLSQNGKYVLRKSEAFYIKVEPIEVDKK